MNKKEFKEIEAKFLEEEIRWKSLNIGDKIYSEIPRFIEFDYHEHLILKINIDERYVEALDLSVTPNKVIKCTYFLTEDEFKKAI